MLTNVVEQTTKTKPRNNEENIKSYIFSISDIILYILEETNGIYEGNMENKQLEHDIAESNINDGVYDFDDYVRDSERTLSKPDSIFHPIETFRSIYNLSLISDNLKKHIFYGDVLDDCPVIDDDFNTKMFDYLINDVEENKMNTIHAILGIVSEVGEIIENVVLDKGKTNLVEELSDIQWYMSILYRQAGISPYIGLKNNINKLRKRFPDKFDSQLAKHHNRDLESEKEELKKGIE